jgi:nitrate reductase gamma subunit
MGVSIAAAILLLGMLSLLWRRILNKKKLVSEAESDSVV